MPPGTRALGGVFGDMLDPLLRKVLKNSRATHRAARDTIDRTARRAQVDDIARRQGVPASSVPRATPYNHPVSKHTNAAVTRGADPAEVARQRDLYQNGMNSQTVDDALARAKKVPRRPKSTKERNILRKELKEQAYRDLRKQGCDPAEAKQWAKQYADEQFPSGSGSIPQPVLHNPDMNVGGPKPAHTYGDWDVNNALSHSARGSAKDDFVKYLEAEKAAGRGGHLVNVTLT